MAVLDEAHIQQLVYAAVDELNKQLPKAKKLEKSPTTALAGAGGPLDSLGIVNLLFNTEAQVERALGMELMLTDEAAAADEAAFATLASYCAFVKAVAEKQSHG